MDSFFRKIVNKGTSLFSSSSTGDTVVGIDIGTSSIKVVQIKKRSGKAVLETYGSIALGSYAGIDIGQVTNLSKEKLGEALSAVLREIDVTTKIASMSIASASSLIFIIELPVGIRESQLGEIVPNESRKYIPVPISEVSLDWWVIPKHHVSGVDEDEEEEAAAIRLPSKTEVLVVAIHNESISRYRDVIKTNQLSVDSFEIEAFSAIRSLFAHELAPVVLIDFGASKTKLSVIEYGVVKTFHIINKGSADITASISKTLNISFPKAEEIKKEFGVLSSQTDEAVISAISLSLDYIFNEANSVVLNYEKKYNKAVSKVILSGGGSLLKGFLEKAEENFRAPVIMGDPFSKVESPVFLSEVLRSIGPEFSVALGLALKRLES